MDPDGIWLRRHTCHRRSTCSLVFSICVVPAKAVIHPQRHRWTPASAGVTSVGLSCMRTPGPATSILSPPRASIPAASRPPNPRRRIRAYTAPHPRPRGARSRGVVCVGWGAAPAAKGRRSGCPGRPRQVRPRVLRPVAMAHGLKGGRCRRRGNAPYRQGSRMRWTRPLLFPVRSAGDRGPKSPRRVPTWCLKLNLMRCRCGARHPLVAARDRTTPPRPRNAAREERRLRARRSDDPGPMPPARPRATACRSRRPSCSGW